MISHVTVGTNDFAAALHFYEPLMARLDWRLRFSNSARGRAGWEPAAGGRPLFLLGRPLDGAPASAGNGAMVALVAPDRAAVDDLHRMAMAAGGTDEGAPGLRPHYHPDYYGAYFRDRDGNKICICCHAAPGEAAADASDAPVAPLTRDDMLHHAQAWIAAWNRRDVEAVASAFSAEARFRSPFALQVTGHATLDGRAAIRAYWDAALARIDALEFRLLDTICDVPAQRMVVHYQATLGATTRRACEIFVFQRGVKIEAEALYGDTLPLAAST